MPSNGNSRSPATGQGPAPAPVRHRVRWVGTVPGLVTLTSSLLLSACDVTPSSANISLAIVNGRVWTGDSTRPWADALAVSGDTILAVGTSAEIRKLGTPDRLVDAKGGLVAPGFIDSHVHFIDGGFRLSSVQLRDAKTPEEFTRRIKEFAATVPAGAWITGGDWDHEQWGGRLPERSWIDSVTPDHPVWVNRLDGHMALANSAALRAAGVSAATKDVTGGAIVRGPGTSRPASSRTMPRTSSGARFPIHRRHCRIVRWTRR